jgi:hypothetical protein
VESLASKARKMVAKGVTQNLQEGAISTAP